MIDLRRAMRFSKSGMWTILLLGLSSILSVNTRLSNTIYHRILINSTANANNEVRLDSQLNITCVYPDLIGGFGTPSVTWSKTNNCRGSTTMEVIYTSAGAGSAVLDGFFIEPKIITDLSSSGSIHFSEMSVSDSSCYSYTYSCQVQSYDGISIDYTKHVYSASLDISLTDPARVVSITKDVVVREKEGVTLSCKTTGIPEPVVTWSKSDQTPLPANIGGGYTYQSEDKDGVLELPAVTKDASGTYICSAMNRIVNEPILRSVSVQVEYAPHIEVKSLRVSQKLGYHTELFCQVEANPNDITASWYSESKDNSKSTSQANTKYRISIEEDKRVSVIRHVDERNVTTGSTLVIQHVNKADYQTLYCCQFTNRIGSNSRCISILASNTPVRVNGKKARLGQSANHSNISADISHTLIILTVMVTSLCMSG